MKKAILSLSLAMFMAVSVGSVQAADAAPDANNGIPAEIQDLINKILDHGCLDQHIIRTNPDGSTTKLDQKVGPACNATSSQTALDQHIDQHSSDSSTKLDQTITFPTGTLDNTNNSSNNNTNNCLDQHIDNTTPDSHTKLDQNVCGQILAAAIPTPTPAYVEVTPTATPTPAATATELPATGPGGLMVVVLGSVITGLIGKRFFQV